MPDAQVCVVSPSSTELGQLTSGLQSLTLAATESADREPAMELGGGGQGNEVRGALGGVVVQLVGSILYNTKLGLKKKKEVHFPWNYKRIHAS